MTYRDRSLSTIIIIVSIADEIIKTDQSNIDAEFPYISVREYRKIRQLSDKEIFLTPRQRETFGAFKERSAWNIRWWLVDIGRYRCSGEIDDFKGRTDIHGRTTGMDGHAGTVKRPTDISDFGRLLHVAHDVQRYNRVIFYLAFQFILMHIHIFMHFISPNSHF